MSLIERYRLNPVLAGLQAYPVPPSAGMVKLDAMESPFGWPSELNEPWQQAMAAAPVNRYPDAGASELKQALGEAYPLPDGYQLLLGNGSDELIQLLCMAVLRPGAVVMAPDPSFVMYRHLAEMLGLSFVGVPLDERFDLDAQRWAEALATHQPALVFVPQPNNPTANRLDAEVLAQICAQAPGLVVIDEAYIPYAGGDSTALAARHDNVLLMRTLSKWGLAGLRLGFLAAQADLIERLEPLRLPYNINVLTQRTATLALAHRQLFERRFTQICAERERVAAELAQRPGVEVFPSATNFLLCRVGAERAQALHAHLREHGVLIKCLDGGHPRLAGCLRPSIGTVAENDRMLALWREFDANFPTVA